ncbi:CopG family transcriptional regulator [Bradyrhizobium sp. 2TAF24]|uniref:ribbon-helix-helix domain-containing protein n=1 Tax=Bradyrhizobium sp. 2TAF24 TaxID=3233011 RepID=UPI003F8FA5A7
MGTYMHFHPDNARSYVGFNLPADQLAALDQARIELRLSRSEFMRQAVTVHLRQLQATAK